MRNPSRGLATVAASLLAAGLVLVPLSAGGQEQGRDPGAQPGVPTPPLAHEDPPGEAGANGWDGDGPAPLDVVFIDDLIVGASACVGTHCVNGETFGMDTLRLKEPNLRLAFRDTSGGSFPTRDWHLEANSTNDNGASYFGIRDCGDTSSASANCGGTMVFRIDATAPANSLRVDDSGNLGVRTVPAADLHIRTGDSPTVRLEQDGSGGFAAQTWDVAGNEANFFVRNPGTSQLPFRIRPEAPGNALMIAASGDVGLGIATPGAPLHVLRSNNPSIRMTASAPGHAWDVSVSDAGALFYNKLGAAGTEMRLQADGTLRITGSLIAEGGDGSVDPGDTFPDYVFASGYELRSLAELAAFVEANGHLPGVMSAADVSAEGGINMTALQLQMLEKIEELTLYTLAQHDRITALEADKAALAGRLAALEAVRDSGP